MNPSIDKDLPIGVFDSGVGGLTVLHAIRDALPAENLVYLGDTARLPYGTKSPASIERYALQYSADSPETRESLISSDGATHFLPRDALALGAPGSDGMPASR